MLRIRRYLFPCLLLLAGLLLGGCGATESSEPQATTMLDSFLAFLADPTVAYLLLVFGLLALMAELATPGVTIPGVIGLICLVLSAYGLLHLPTNWLGLALILAAIAMFLLDIKVAGIALSVGGIIAFGLGSMLLFTPPWIAGTGESVARLNPWLVAATTAGVSLFFIFGVAAGIRAHYFPVATGRETLPGRKGVVKQDLAPQGIVHIEGEEWSATTPDGRFLPAGTPVTVVRVKGLTVIVTD